MTAKPLNDLLNWRYATKKMDPSKAVPQDKVDAIMEDEEALKPHRGILRQDVLSSVYAKAYNINGLKAKNWPTFGQSSAPIRATCTSKKMKRQSY